MIKENQLMNIAATGLAALNIDFALRSIVKKYRELKKKSPELSEKQLVFKAIQLVLKEAENIYDEKL